MRADNLDPTGGERARAIHQDPAAPQPILDPTDPRHRKLRNASEDGGIESRRISDPTNPEFGQLPA